MSAATTQGRTANGSDVPKEQVVATPGPELDAALDDAVVQLTRVKENVDQAASDFAKLRQGIPNYNEVIADIRQQQMSINHACEAAATSAQTIVSDVEQAAERLCSSIDEEILTIKSVMGGGAPDAPIQGGQQAQPSQPEPAAAQPQVTPTMAGLNAGGQMGLQSGLHPGVMPSVAGSPSQEMVAVQVADALRDYLRREIKREISEQFGPINQKLMEIVVGHLQERGRDR